METIESLFRQYGYLVLLLGLFLEFIALPFPGELTMSYCGYLVFLGKMNWILSILVATAGATMGITVSYVLGKGLGYPFFYKYGKFIHLDRKRMNRHAVWFEKYGGSILFFAYFFPGLRHISGYFSGIIRLKFSKFARSAYCGAAFWTTAFISIGVGIGPKWSRLYDSLSRLGAVAGILLFLVILLYYVLLYYRNRIISGTIQQLRLLLRLYHSMGKIKIFIALAAAVFLGLTAWMIALIQEFITNEHTQFDTITNYLIRNLRHESWDGVFRFFIECASPYSILILLGISIFIILEKSKDRFLEIRGAFITILGGELVIRILNMVFHRYSPNGQFGSRYTYPSPEAMLVVIEFGFVMFLCYRYMRNQLFNAAVAVASILIAILAGQGILYFQLERPSDVMAGYIFGGVWLSLNLILLEIYRILPMLKNTK